MYHRKEWCDEYCETDLMGRLDHAKSMMEDYWKVKPSFDAQAQRLYQNFLEIVYAKKDPLLLARRTVC